MSASLHIVLVTAPDADVGRKLAAAILNVRAGACVSIVPGLESHYWWEGKIDHSSEVLLLIKTTKAKLKALEKVVRENHPYDTPEFVAIAANIVSKKYLEWVCDSVKRA
jgi:periplasmic divalent cation tolerance protein